MTAPVIGAQMREVYCVETGFAGQMDSTVFQHSATNNGLSSNNRFRFQGKRSRGQLPVR
jgi:hypothetical protein